MTDGQSRSGPRDGGEGIGPLVVGGETLAELTRSGTVLLRRKPRGREEVKALREWMKAAKQHMAKGKAES